MPNEIIIHGFLTSDGVKISKSLGNGADPFQLIQDYGSDAVRFYLLHILSYKEDSDFVEPHLKDSYNSELANKFGNLVSRILTLKNKIPEFTWQRKRAHQPNADFSLNFIQAFQLIDKLNKEINDTKPWELLKGGTHETLSSHLKPWLSDLDEIGILLNPLLPQGCFKLHSLLETNSLKIESLYPRK